MGEKMVKTRVSMTLDSKTVLRFEEFCKRNGCAISSRVNVLMEDDVKRGDIE